MAAEFLLENKDLSPFIGLLGIEFTEVGAGVARGQLQASKDRHLNMRGYLHGGVTFSLIDTCMGAALYPMLGPTEAGVTLEIQIEYISGMQEGLLECVATVTRRGRSVAFLEGKVTKDGALIAKATGSYAIVSR